jgi:hypothetical protein
LIENIPYIVITTITTTMVEEQFEQVKLSLDNAHFNPQIHGKILYKILKNNKNVPYVGTMAHVAFPHYKAVSTDKYTTIQKMRLPTEIIDVIQSFVFENLEEVRYSLFYLVDEIHDILFKNMSMSNSFSSFNINENESVIWHWEFLDIYLHAENCKKCGNYRNTNTPNVPVCVLCVC